jgi:hypothetical protein
MVILYRKLNLALSIPLLWTKQFHISVIEIFYIQIFFNPQQENSDDTQHL